MDLELLHTQAGDRKKKINTDTPEGRKEASDFIQIQIRKGTHLILERGKKNYKITGYDPKTDSLHVIAEDHAGNEKEVKASSKKGKAVGIPPIAGGLA